MQEINNKSDDQDTDKLEQTLHTPLTFNEALTHVVNVVIPTLNNDSRSFHKKEELWNVCLEIIANEKENIGNESEYLPFKADILKYIMDYSNSKAEALPTLADCIDTFPIFLHDQIRQHYALLTNDQQELYLQFLKERGEKSEEIHIALNCVETKGKLLNTVQETEKAQFTYQYITLRDRYNRELINGTDNYDPETFLSDLKQMDEEISAHLERNNSPNIKQLIKDLPSEMQTAIFDHFNDELVSKEEKEAILLTLQETAPLYLKAISKINSSLPAIINGCEALTVHSQVGTQAGTLLQTILTQEKCYRENLALWNNQYSPLKFLEYLSQAKSELDILSTEKEKCDQENEKKLLKTAKEKESEEENYKTSHEESLIKEKEAKKVQQEQETKEAEQQKIITKNKEGILKKSKAQSLQKILKNQPTATTAKKSPQKADQNDPQDLEESFLGETKTRQKSKKIKSQVDQIDTKDSLESPTELEEKEAVYTFEMQGALKSLLTTMRLNHDKRSIELFNELFILMKNQKLSMSGSNFFNVQWLQRKDRRLYHSMRTLFEVQRGHSLEEIFEACVSTKSWNRVLQAKPSELRDRAFDLSALENNSENTLKIPTEEEVESAEVPEVHISESASETRESQSIDSTIHPLEADLEPIMTDIMPEVDPTNAKFLNNAPEDTNKEGQELPELPVKLQYPNQWCRSVFEALEQIDQSDIMQLHRSIPSLLESLEGAADVELFMENVREIHPASYDLLYDITERSSDNSDFLENLYEQLQVLDPSIITAEDDSNDDLDSAADNTEYADDEDSMDEDETENVLTRHPWPQSFNKYIDRLDDETVGILNEYYPHILEVAETSESFEEYNEVLSSISELASILSKTEMFLSAIFDEMGNANPIDPDEKTSDWQEEDENGDNENQDLESDLEEQEALEEDETHDPKLSDEIAELIRDYLPYLIQFAHESETFEDFLEKITSEESFPEELADHVSILRGIFAESRSIIDEDNESAEDTLDQPEDTEADLEEEGAVEITEDVLDATFDQATEEYQPQETDMEERVEENEVEDTLPDNIETAPLENLNVMLTRSLAILEKSDDKSRFIQSIRNDEQVGTWLKNTEINHHGFKDFFIQSLWQQRTLIQDSTDENPRIELHSFFQEWLKHLSPLEKKRLLSALYILLKMQHNQEASFRDLCLNSKKWRKMVNQHPCFFFMLHTMDEESLEQVLEQHCSSEQSHKQTLSLFDLLHYVQNVFKKSHCYFELKNLKLVNDQYLYLSDEDLDRWFQGLNNYIQPHQIFWGELSYKGANKMYLETSSFKKIIPNYLENALFKADYQDSLELEYVHINAL